MGNCQRPGAHSRLQFFPGTIHPKAISFPHLGQFIQATPLRKQKNPCLNKETKAISSAVPLFLPDKHVRPLKFCPVTGASGEAYFYFSPLLQGDVPRLLPSALHLNGGSLCVSEAGTFPFPRGFPYLPEYLICFLSCCQGEGVYFFNRRGGCNFLSDQKVTKESLGAAFDERLRAAGAHRRLAPKPPFYGGRSSSQSPLCSGHPSMGIHHVASLLLLSPPNPLRWALAGTPIDPIWFFLPRGHRPLLRQKLENRCAVRTPPALAEPWQLVRPTTAAPNR